MKHPEFAEKANPGQRLAGYSVCEEKLATNACVDFYNEIAGMGNVENIAGAFVEIIQIQTIGPQSGCDLFHALALGTGISELDFRFADFVLDDEPVEHTLLTGQGVIAEIGYRHSDKKARYEALDRVHRGPPCLPAIRRV